MLLCLPPSGVLPREAPCNRLLPVLPEPVFQLLLQLIVKDTLLMTLPDMHASFLDLNSVEAVSDQSV
jgi:hypothetical protein